MNYKPYKPSSLSGVAPPAEALADQMLVTCLVSCCACNHFSIVAI